MNEKQTIKTTVIEVAGLLSALSARGVEKRLRGMPGVEQAEVNYVAGSANVTYDETRTDLEAIKGRVEECGYHCAGELLPRHVCRADDPSGEALTAVPAAESHRGHTDHAEHAAAEVEAADMAHDMGHGGGMDMQAMVRDMRNRFWICLVFAVPIFIYSPMGELFTPPPPPFGLELNLWVFLLATVAVIWPSWPFFVAAWRALKNGVLNMAVLVVLSVGTGYLFSLGAGGRHQAGYRRLRQDRHADHGRTAGGRGCVGEFG